MNEKPNPMTEQELERELAAMTESSTGQTELWREALQQTRREDGTRRIPGRRRFDLNRSVKPIELMVVLLVLVTFIGVMTPSLGRARRSADTPSQDTAAETAIDRAPSTLGAIGDYASLDSDLTEGLVESSVAESTDRQGNRAASELDALGAGANELGRRALQAESRSAAAPRAAFAQADRKRESSIRESPSDSRADASPTKTQAADQPAARSIAVQSSLSLIVPDAERAVRSCESLIDAARGEFVQASGITRRADNWSGTITLRVVSDRREDVIAAIRDLGEVERETSSAEDLTVSIADAGARLRSLRQVESELTDLLVRRENDTLADIVTAQAELGKTRGEIESLEARLRTQRQLVRLATINVTVREHGSESTESWPAFGRTVVSAGHDALALLDRVVYLIVVASPIWLTSLLVWIIWRTARRRNVDRDLIGE